MKNLFYLISLIPMLVLGQSASENYIKTTNYKKELLGTYNNASVSFGTNDILLSSSGGGSGSIVIQNNILTFSMGSSFSSSTRLKLGNIKQINSVPAITNLELGQILTSSSQPTGYYAKIKNNWLVFYSPYFPNYMTINSTVNIPGGSTISAYTVSTGIPYTCPAGQSGGGSGSIIVNRNSTSGTISINISGGWSQLCTLTTFPSSVVTLNSSYAIPDTELGIISGGDFNTVYKARIKNHKLEFYSDEIIPLLPTSGNLQSSFNFGGNVGDKFDVVTYFDGIGRPIQKVESKKSVMQQDVITHIEYDAFGRQAKEYLPYSKWYGNSNMNYITSAKSETLAYYSSYDPNVHGNPNFDVTNYPYSEKLYQASTLEKVLKEAEPGSPWRMNGGHETKYDFTTNITNEVRKFKLTFYSGTTEDHTFAIDGFYTANTLLKSIIKDENWISGFDNTMQEFKDLDGKIVLRRAFNQGQAYNTYYIYDLYGNLAYIIPPTASDAIDAAYGNSAVLNRSYPWTSIALVDNQLAEEYNKLFSDYNNQLIADADLYQKYGGQGGFIISSNDENELLLTINITTATPMKLKTGEILSLDELGNFKDGEIGRITGPGYQYILSVSKNSLIINGEGAIRSVNANFTGTTKLTYNTNYPWASLVDIDSKEADDIIKKYNELDNSNILSAEIPNQYGATGGVNIIIDENDNVSLNLNISAQQSLKFKKGTVIQLQLERSIPDTELAVVESNGMNYRIGIRDNNLYIEGTGWFTNIIRAVSPINPPTMAMPQTIIDGLCFIYHHDYRNRIVEKKMPGKGWEYIVYDKLDRVVLNQDALLRLQNKWLFKKYDSLSREVYNGQMDFISPSSNVNSALRIEVQALVNGNTVINESRSSVPFTDGGININYTNLVYPTQSSPNFMVHSVYYFDDYTFRPYGVAINIPTTSYNSQSTNDILQFAKSSATGGLTRVLSTNDWILNVIAYNQRSSPVWTKTTNSYLQSEEIVENQLDFVGKIMASKTTHNKVGVTANLIVLDKFTYDHADRLIKQTQKTGSNVEELIVFNKYDELGKLVQKKVGGPAPSSGVTYDLVLTALQTVDYSYNVRGWMRKINDPDLNLTDDLFALKMNYDTPELGSTPLYNNNVSEVRWRTKSNPNNQIRSYKYSYDALNRMTQADYVGNYQLVSNPSQIENYTEGNISYDKNGNIIHLERYGLKSDMVTIDKIDDLQYNYNTRSNKLKQVVDFADTAGFKDINDATNIDYTYDVNGNLTTDINKKIINVEYNFLNLPTKIEFSFTDNPNVLNYGKIDIVYNSKGDKMSSTVYKTGLSTIYPLKVTQYIGNFKYQGEPNLTLQYFSHTEGYVSNSAGVYSYIYQYKDLLGNVRLSYKKNSTTGLLDIIEENNFYPFGLKHKGYNSAYIPVGNALADKIKYQGQERQEDLGLNWDSFKFRNYDYELGRFHSIDPLAEKYAYNSAYAFQENKLGLGRELEGLELQPWNSLSGQSVGVIADRDSSQLNNALRQCGISTYARDVIITNYNNNTFLSLGTLSSTQSFTSKTTTSSSNLFSTTSTTVTKSTSVTVEIGMNGKPESTSAATISINGSIANQSTQTKTVGGQVGATINFSKAVSINGNVNGSKTTGTNTTLTNGTTIGTNGTAIQGDLQFKITTVTTTTTTTTRAMHFGYSPPTVVTKSSQPKISIVYSKPSENSNVKVIKVGDMAVKDPRTGTAPDMEHGDTEQGE